MRIFLLLLINFYLTCVEQRLHLSNDQGNLALHSVCTLFDLLKNNLDCKSIRYSNVSQIYPNFLITDNTW